MFKRAGIIMGMAVAVLCAGAQQARAQQTLNFTLGYFSVRGEDARTTGDVLTSDRTFLTFDVKDFNGPTIGGEWLVPFGNYLEGGAGVSFSRRTVPSIYTDFIAPEGGEIAQDLRLRMVPISFTVRALPLGQSSPIQPYIGGGLAVINWRYSESGEFADFSNGGELFTDTFVGSGHATGPVALGGIRFSGDRAAAGFEVRYQSAKADLPASEFASSSNPAPRIDLGGWTYQLTAGVRFGR
jgi:hypothetical protein